MSFVDLVFVPSQQGWQVAFRPNTPHPSFSQYSTWVNVRPLRALCLCFVVAVTAASLESPDDIWWTQVLGRQMKSSSYACRLIDKQTQFSVGCQQYMHTHLMSPVLAITSGTANDRPCHILKWCEHSCNLIFQFPARIGHIISNCCHLL